MMDSIRRGTKRRHKKRRLDGPATQANNPFPELVSSLEQQGASLEWNFFSCFPTKPSTNGNNTESSPLTTNIFDFGFNKPPLSLIPDNTNSSTKSPFANRRSRSPFSPVGSSSQNAELRNNRSPTDQLMYQTSNPVTNNFPNSSSTLPNESPTLEWQNRVRDKCSINNLLSSPMEDADQIQPPKPAICQRRETGILYKLTANISETYYKIECQLQAQKPQHEVADPRYDSENFEYKIRAGEVLHNRYTIISGLGKGTFGQVVKCFDNVAKMMVAIKIIKSQQIYTQQGRREIELLEEINCADDRDVYGIVKLLGHFMHCKHLCLVFEILATNLYDVLKSTKFTGLSLPLIRKIAYQVANSLQFLSPKGVDVIHSDLKPENILLLDPTKSGVKIIDFGSSCHSHAKIYSYIQSRFYRAPEVILESGYNHSIDMWSLGCILVELHTGVPLFAGDNAADQLCKISELVEIPMHMIRSSPRASDFFSYSNGKYTMRGYSGRRINLWDLLGGRTGGPNGRWQGQPSHEPTDYDKFIDFVSQMLKADPKERIKPGNALQHPFFTSELNWCDMPTKDDDKRPTGQKRKPASLIIGVKSPKKYRKPRAGSTLNLM